MKPRIKKDAYTGRWQCVSKWDLGRYELIKVGYGGDAREAYEDWERQCCAAS